MVVPVYTPSSSMWKFQRSCVFNQHKYYTVNFVLLPIVFTEYYAFKINMCHYTHIPSNYCIVSDNRLLTIDFFFWLFGMMLVSVARLLFACPVPIPLFSVLTITCVYLHGQVLQPQPSEVTLRSSKPIMAHLFPLWPFPGQWDLKGSQQEWTVGRLLLKRFLSSSAEIQGRGPLFLPQDTGVIVVTGTVAPLVTREGARLQMEKLWVHFDSTKLWAILPPDLFDEKIILVGFSYLQPKRSHYNK